MSGSRDLRVYGVSAARERPGWFLGLTGPQAFLVLAAGVPCWLAMAVGRWPALLALAPAWLLVAVLVCLPIRGWSAVQWLGVATRHLVGRATGWSGFQSRAAAGLIDLGGPDDDDGGEAAAGDRPGSLGGVGSRPSGEADLPGVLAGVEIHDGPPMPGSTARPAIIQNHAARTWAATARLMHAGIGMSDPDERDRMGAALAELLESAATSGRIQLLAFQVRTVPDDGTERTDWVRRHAHATEPELSANLHAQLDGMTAGAAVRHEAFLTVVVGEEAIGKDARRAGGGVIGRARILYGLLAEVEARLTGGIGCARVTWLDTPDLAVAIRTGFEPGDAPALADAALQHARDPRIPAGVPVFAAGPTNAATGWRCYRHGDWESTSATLLLPRKGALMGSLARALVPSQTGERRALTVFYRPVTHGIADRSTARAEMSAAMGAEMRRKIGRVERARDRRAAALLRETDEKLEHGRALVKVCAVMSVTAPASTCTAASSTVSASAGTRPGSSTSSSAGSSAGGGGQDVGRRLDASIRLCGFTPLLLDGAQDAAFAASAIPLGTGLPSIRR